MGKFIEVPFTNETRGRGSWPSSEGPSQTTNERLPQASGEYTHLINTDRDGDRAEVLGQDAAEDYLVAPGRLFRVIDNILYPNRMFAAKKMEKDFVNKRLRLAGAGLMTTALLGLNMGGYRDALGDILQRFYKDPAAVVNDGSCYREGDNVGPTNALGECPK